MTRLVCIDCRYVNSRPSGIAETVMALVDYIPTMAPDLRFRLLVSPNASFELSHLENVEQVEVSAAANGPATMWGLPIIADLKGVDLFHATFNIMPAGLGMPCITTIHDLMWLERPEWCATGWRRYLRQLFFAHGIKRALNQSAIIATVSEATKNALVLGRPDASPRTFVTLSGVSDEFKPSACERGKLSAFGLNPERRFVLTVGQFAPYKNHLQVIRSFAQVCATRKDVDLVLVQRQGSGSAALRRFAERLGVGGRIFILPAVSRADLIMLYSSAELLLHPSLCEGFGNPLAEAMACGCPVVTSDRSAMVEVTAGAAMLIDPNDTGAIARAVCAIIDDQALRSTMRESGLLRATQLNWSEFARANLALYRRALRGEPSRVNNSASIALSARVNRIFNQIRAPFRRMIS